MPEAQWIFVESPDAAPRLSAAGYFDFVREVERPTDDCGDWEIDLTAFSFYQLWVDGVFVGRGPAAGYQNLAFFDRWRVSVRDREAGAIRIAVRVFHEGIGAESAQDFDYGLPGLLVGVRAGERTLAVSDEGWRWREAPEYGATAARISPWGGFKEIWHAERVDGWMAPGFDARNWREVVALGRAASSGRVGELRLRETPVLTSKTVEPVRVVCANGNLGTVLLDGSAASSLPADCPVAVEAGPGEPLAAPEATWDFGWVRTGYPEIRAEGAAGVLEVSYGESLDLLRCDILNLPEGGATWSAFHRRSFRFLRIRFLGLEGPVRIVGPVLREERYPFPDDVAAASGEPLADGLVAATRRTLAAATSHHYEDCPWREQALWIVDARIMALANAWLAGDPRVSAKSLRQIFALQRPTGAVAATGPKDNCFYFLDFMLHIVPMTAFHLRLTGDRSLVGELLPRIEKLCAFADGWVDERGLLDATGAADQRIGIFFDWSRTLGREGCTTILNALYAVHLEEWAWLLRKFGRSGEAQRREEQAARVRAAARDAFFDPRRGLYRDACEGSAKAGAFSLQANIAALYAGFEGGERAVELFDRAVSDPELPRPFGPSFYHFVFSVMHRLGRTEMILAWLRDYWGGMLERGATTWWEVFNPGLPRSRYPHPFLGQTPTYEREEVPVSLCHGWSCVPGYAVPLYLFGIDVGSVGLDGVVRWDAGVPAFFDSFDYRVHTAKGPVHLRLHRKDSLYDLEVLESSVPVERQAADRRRPLL